MVPYLIGGLGLLGGVIAALIFKLRYQTLKGEFDLLSRDHGTLKEKNTKIVDDHTSEVARLNSVIDGLQTKERGLRDEVRTLMAKCSDPVTLNNQLNRLFPLPQEVPTTPSTPTGRGGGSP